MNFIDKEEYIVNLYDYYVSHSEQKSKQPQNVYDQIFNQESEDEFTDLNEKKKEDFRSETNRYDVLKDFVCNCNRNICDYQNYRLDKAIINTVENFSFIANEERNLNFLIAFASLDAGFSFNENLIEEFTRMLYIQEYSLVLCFYYDTERMMDEKVQLKLKCYKKLISKYVINGQIFFIKNFKAVKFVLNSINFDKFDYLNFLKLHDFIEILDLD